MTDDDLARLLADPPPDPAFGSRIDALVRADRLLAARRREAWRRFGAEAAGAAALATVAALLSAAPPAAALAAATLPLAWLLACLPRLPGSVVAR
jgi:hypothetical protein